MSRNTSTLVLCVAFALGVLAGATFFSRYTTFAAFPRFVVSAIVLYWLPGGLVLRALGLRAAPAEWVALAFLTGAILTGVVDLLLTFAGAPGLLAGWAVAVVGVWVVLLATGQARLRAPRLAPLLEHVLLLGVIAASFVPLAFFDLYWRNLVAEDDGSVTFFRIPDAVFHLAIGQELAHDVPPGIPWLSGVALPYHYGMDLVAVVAARLGDLPLADVTLRFLPMCFLAVAATASYAFARAWARNGLVAVVVAALVLFGEDFSWIPGLFRDAQGPWGAYFFQIPTVFSLYYLNPMLPALALLMGALLCLLRYVETRRRSWAVLVALFTATLVEVKIFTSVQLVLALLGAAAILYWRRRSTVLLTPVVLTIALSLPAGLLAYLQVADSPNETRVVLDSPYLRETLGTLSLEEFGVNTRALFVVALPLFLVGTLGARIVGIPAMFSSRAQRGGAPEVRTVMVLFVVLGLVLTLFTTINLPGTISYNNSVWFYVAAKYVLWIFAGEAIAVLAGKRRVVAVLAAATMLALSAPATLQFFHSTAQSSDYSLLPGLPNRLDPSQVDMLQALDDRCGAGDVVLAEDSVLVPMVSLTRCRTPYLDVLTPYLLAADPAARRVSDVAAFWRAWRRGTCRGDVVARYGVRFVVVRSAAARAPRSCGARRLVRSYGNQAFAVLHVSS